MKVREGDWKFLIGVEGVEGNTRISSSSPAAIGSAPLEVLLPLVREVPS